MTSLPAFDTYLAISAVKTRYCRALDTKDWAAFGDCFADDIQFDLQMPNGQIFHGREAVVDLVSSSVAGATTAHQVHTPEITMQGADAADVIWPMYDRVLWPAETAKKVGHARFTGYGYYLEHYVRQADIWRIARLVLTRLHVDTEPL